MKHIRRCRDVTDDPVDVKKLAGHDLLDGLRGSTGFRAWQGAASSVYAENRTVVLSPDNDPNDTLFPSNRITSNKYTLWTFVPKNLFEQFRRIANFYFLVTAVVAITIESPISPLTSSLPLAFVVLVTACKQGYEDYMRYKVDQRLNRRLVTVIRNRCMQDVQCEQIVVGDLVKIHRDEDIPCDLILLRSEDNLESCYVTTSNLDGETNLKTLRVPKVVSSMTVAQIATMEATITCQNPHADLYTFHGKLETTVDNEPASGHLSTEHLLLRGATLKDTDYVIGCAVYTGYETKLSLNSKITHNKFSTAEKTINRYLLVFVALLLAEVFLATIMKIYYESIATWYIYIGIPEAKGFTPIATNVLNFTILYNYIVPISLYVTVELQKFLGSYFFAWDAEIYDEATDQPALANTSDLNEELGQVEYLFSDKTGTLTENLMVFRRCSINGETYMEKDCDGHLYWLPPSGNVDEAEKISEWKSEIWHFMISISLCHVVQIAPPSNRPTISARRVLFRESFRQKKVTVINSSLLMDPDLPEYQAASADEKALVEASARCGVVFQRDTNSEVEIRVNEKVLMFKKLEILEFTSERKRMSVILKDAADDIWLYCKGADSVVFPLIVKGKIEETKKHVADFALRGLRTLVVGCKKMNTKDYERLMQNVELARQVMGIERQTYVEGAYGMMEGGLTLLGVTAVEDRLQNGVQETLECLRVAGIKVWVLTGDKAETAENIAFLCGHFKNGTEILRLTNQDTAQSCFMMLTGFERKVKLEPYKQYGLLIDGGTVALALLHCPELLRNVGMVCESVVCCRMTPLQKSEIVRLLKGSEDKPLTAAIGDGGNDVSMIQEAHVGIGIMGKEGRQATMSADFAIAKFMYLKKVLLVHGHWYYLRISVLTQYFFYKNLVFITPQVLFGFQSGFSTQEFFDGLFLMCFNVIFTSTPVLMYGLFEQDYSASKLMRHPHLYKLYRKNYLLSWPQFAVWIAEGVWHTCAIYFFCLCYLHINPISLHDNTPMDHWTFSTCVFHIVTLVLNVKILLCSLYWTLPLVLCSLFSEIIFLGFALVYSNYNLHYDGDMLWVTHHLLQSPSVWVLTLIVLVICLIPDCLINIYNTYRPMRIQRKNEEVHKF